EIGSSDRRERAGVNRRGDREERAAGERRGQRRGGGSSEVQRRHALHTTIRERREDGRAPSLLERRLVAERRAREIVQRLDGYRLSFRREPHPRAVDIALPAGSRGGEEER